MPMIFLLNGKIIRYFKFNYFYVLTFHMHPRSSTAEPKVINFLLIQPNYPKFICSSIFINQYESNNWLFLLPILIKYAIYLIYITLWKTTNLIVT